MAVSVYLVISTAAKSITRRYLFLRDLSALCLSGRTPAAAGPDWPDNVHFTFQFYRFPPVTTQQLRLLSSERVVQKPGAPLPCVLACVNKDGTVDSGEFGFQSTASHTHTCISFSTDGKFVQITSPLSGMLLIHRYAVYSSK